MKQKELRLKNGVVFHLKNSVSEGYNLHNTDLKPEMQPKVLSEFNNALLRAIDNRTVMKTRHNYLSNIPHMKLNKQVFLACIF
jgi:hypothetical protein